MKNTKCLVFILPLLSIFLFQCKEETPENLAPDKTDILKDTTPKIATPNFNEDSAYQFIFQQVAFGPRVPNTQAHKECGLWLESKLTSYNFEVLLQEAEVVAWNGDKLQMKNIIGQYDKDNPERILLCAHWDTRPYADKDSVNKFKPIDGANDGGSGVGVLLEIARQISITSPGYGVDIIFFDAEDYGTIQDGGYESVQQMLDDWCLGSQYWARNPPIPNYKPKYGILLDMVGAPNATFPKEGFSMKYAAAKVTAIWNAAENLGYGNYFVKKLAGSITDDHTFINKIAGIPTLDIIDMNVQGQYWTFGAYHHTHGDNMDIIDKKTLKAVGQTVLYAVYQKI
jgi:glutaminyl-peptide cyclotransferase